MALTPEQQEQLDRIEGKLDRAFNGPEGEPHKGVWVRLDRLERVAFWAVRFAGLAIVGAIAAIWGSVWTFITAGHPPSPGNHP